MTAPIGVHYYQRHLGDYARDTGHLSMLEHGAYTILLDRIYATGAGIPADKVHRLARAKAPAEREAVDSVLSDFFSLVDGIWINNRAAEELVKIISQADAARENGKKGGRPKGKGKPTQPITPGLPNPNPDQTQIEAIQDPISIIQDKASLPQPPIPDGNTVEGPIGAAAPDDRSGSFEGHTAGQVNEATERGLQLVAVAVQLRKAGCPDARASDAFLVAAIAEGFTLEQLVDLAMAYPGKPVKYLVNTARGRRAEANNPTTAQPQGKPSNVVPHRPGGVSPVLPADELKAREAEALEEMKRQHREYGLAQ